MNITLFGFQGSTYLRTIQMICQFKKIDCDIKPLEFRQASHRALHPFLKMPIMEHEGYKLFESLAIAMYLEDKVTGNSIFADKKIECIQWVSAYIDYIAPVLIKGKPEDETQSWPQTTAEYLQILDQNLSDKIYFCGQSLTVADCYYAPAVEYALGAKGFDDLLAEFKHLKKWWQNISAQKIFEDTAT